MRQRYFYNPQQQLNSQAEPTAVLLSLALEFTKCIWKKQTTIPALVMLNVTRLPNSQVQYKLLKLFSSSQASICFLPFIHCFCLFLRDRVSRCISGGLVWTSFKYKRFTCLCLSSGRIKVCGTSLASP